MGEDLRALVRTPLRVPSPLQRYRPEPGRFAVHEGLVLTASGGTDPAFNSVVVFDPLPAEQVFDRARAFFGDVPYSVVVESDAAWPTEAAVRARGWVLDEEEPALVLTPLPTPFPTAPAGLAIQRVTTEAGFAAFLAISETPRHWVPSLAAATDPAVTLFVGWVGAEPVATSRLTYCDNVGEILGVVTAPAHRRQGFATALTWAACAEGARRGCRAMTLTATAMGYPVYRAMGFVPVCTYRTYLPPAPAGNLG